MYGAAGWAYTPGVPGITPPSKPKGNMAKAPRDERRGLKFDKANQANARRLGVR